MDNKNEKPTLVNGSPTGGTTASGNNNHNEDGTFGSKDAVAKEKINISTEKQFKNINLDDMDFNDEEYNNIKDMDIDSLLFDNDEYDKIKDASIDDILFGDNNDNDGKLTEDQINNIIRNQLNDEEAFNVLYNTPDIDRDKIYGLSGDKLKEIIEAISLLQRGTVEDLLEQYNEKGFVLFNSNLDSKYYETFLQWHDNSEIKAKEAWVKTESNQGYSTQEVLNAWNKFSESGKRYLKKRIELKDKFENAKNILRPLYKNGSISDRKNKAEWYKSTKESLKMLEKETNVLMKNLNSKEINSLESYTGNLYSSLNGALRNLYGKSLSNLDDISKEHLDNITSALNKSSYANDMWVQRGVDKIIDSSIGLNINENITDEELKKLTGTIYKDNGFLSCGAAKSTGFTSNDIIMNIFAPKGTKMLYLPTISHYGTSENEILIQRGYSYKISKAYRADGRIYLDVEVQLNND